MISYGSPTVGQRIHRIKYVIPLCMLVSSAVVAMVAENRSHCVASYDAIFRHAYLTLEDGRRAQVHPYVYADLSYRGLCTAILECLNPLP